MPKISVYMNVYNGKRYIREAIDSILNQSFQDFEFIVVDDGSRDGTEKVLKKYGDRIRVIRHKKNLGAVAALITATNAAKGEYLAHTDADDTSDSERLAVQFGYMERHPDVGTLLTEYYMLDQKTGAISHRKLPFANDAVSRVLDRSCPFCHSTYFIRKSAFLIAGGYDLSMWCSHDFDLLRRLRYCGKIHILQRPLVTYRQHENSLKNSDPLRAGLEFLRVTGQKDLATVVERVAKRQKGPVKAVYLRSTA